MWSRLHNREETPFASSAEDLFAFSLCPSLFCVFSSPSPPAFSKYHQTSSCHLVAHPVGIVSALLANTPTYSSQYERYLLHAQICAEFIEQWSMISNDAKDLLQSMSEYLYSRGQYKEAGMFQQQLIALHERARTDRDSRDYDIKRAFEVLAQIYQAQGEYDQAESLYQRTLALHEEQRSLGLPLADTLCGLAAHYREQDRGEQALSLFQRALFLYEYVLSDYLYETYSSNDATFHGKALGLYEQVPFPDPIMPALHERLESLEMTDHLAKLAKLYSDLGLYKPATSLYQRVLAIYERVLGNDHLDLTDILTNLGEAYLNRGNSKRADLLFERARIITERADPFYLAVSLYNYAWMYIQQEKYEQALLHGQQALTTYERVVDAQHPHVISTLSLLATCYTNLKEYEQAIAYHRRVLEIQEQTLPPYHPKIIQVTEALAEILLIQEQNEQVISLYQNLLTTSKKDALVFASRGRIYRLMQKDAEALADLNKAIDLGDTRSWMFTERGAIHFALGHYQKALLDFNDAIKSGAQEGFVLLNRGLTYHLIERYEEALSDFNKLILLLEKDTLNGGNLGNKENMPDDLRQVYNARADAYWYSGLYTNAVDDYTRLLESGPANPFHFNAYSSRGQVYAEMGKYEKAIEDLDRAIQMGQESNDNIGLAYARNGYALALGGLGQYDQALMEFEASIKLEPENAWVYYNLAMTYKKMGLLEEATANFEISLNKSNPPLNSHKHEQAMVWRTKLRYQKDD